MFRMRVWSLGLVSSCFFHQWKYWSRSCSKVLHVLLITVNCNVSTTIIDEFDRELPSLFLLIMIMGKPFWTMLLTLKESFARWNTADFRCKKNWNKHNSLLSPRKVATVNSTSTSPTLSAHSAHLAFDVADLLGTARSSTFGCAAGKLRHRSDASAALRLPRRL